MLSHFYKLGRELAWSEETKTAGWVAPVAGGLTGAALGSWLFPHLGMEDRAANPMIGALLGAGLGLGGAEMARGINDLTTPIIRQETRQALRKMRSDLHEAIEKVRAEQAQAAMNPTVP